MRAKYGLSELFQAGQRRVEQSAGRMTEPFDITQEKQQFGFAVGAV
jgi:hypothetical protein